MSYVNRLSRRSLAVSAATLVLSGAALAQEAAPAATPAPAPDPPKIDVGGYVDVYYGYNFNETDPLLRTFDVQHNTFSLSAAEVNFAKVPTADSPIGFRTDLFFGKAADLTAAFEPEDDGKEIYKHVQQAYVSLLTGKVQWDAGKFVTPVGAEVIESQDNWNYTRSILFGYAIPFYHLGVRAAVPLTDKVTVGGYLVNGWNNASELNGEKTVGASLTFKPSPSITLVVNDLVGKETEGADTRNIFDTTLTLGLTSKLSVMANFDYGTEGDVSWWGIAGYAKFQATPSWAVVGRYEYLDDTDGGFMTIGDKAQSLTITSDHLIAGAFKARLEYRLDMTDGDYFSKDDGGLTDNQSTVTVGLVYSFAGKI
jgi:hypothetical protein